MMARFLLVNFGCPHCREFMRVVKKINFKLPLDKRISIVDGHSWEKHGVMLKPIIQKFNEDGLKEGYPLCYIELREGEGIVVEPCENFILESYLTKLLEEDFV